MMTFPFFPRRILPVLAGLAFLASWFSPPALAQNVAVDEDKLASLTIQVRPEFDTPDVLVLYNGEFAAKDKLPRDVSVLIPKDAQLYATAYFGTNDTLVNTDPAKSEDSGDGFTRVTFKLPAPKFQVEFYYNPLQGSPDKNMDYVYKAAQAADQLQLQIQEPLKAENFATVPASIVQTSNAHNFKYHIFDYASVAPNQVLKVQVSYRKTDPNPSIQYVTAPATAPVSDTAAATSIPIVPAVGVAGLLAILALGSFAWWTRRPRRAGFAANPSGRTNRGQRRGAGTGTFCTQCGRSLAADDNFCPRCGTKRRS